jgi:hypothetical protein
MAALKAQAAQFAPRTFAISLPPSSLERDFCRRQGISEGGEQFGTCFHDAADVTNRDDCCGAAPRSFENGK